MALGRAPRGINLQLGLKFTQGCQLWVVLVKTLVFIVETVRQNSPGTTQAYRPQHPGQSKTQKIPGPTPANR